MKSLAFVGVGVLLSTTVCSLVDSRAEEKRPQNSFSAAHCHGSIAKTEWTTVCGCGCLDDDHSYSHVQASSWCGTCGTWC